MTDDAVKMMKELEAELGIYHHEPFFREIKKALTESGRIKRRIMEEF